MNEFCVLVKDTYDLFYDYVVEGEIPQEYVSLLMILRKIARLPETSGNLELNKYIAVTGALANWIKFFNIATKYRKLEKGIIIYETEYVLKKINYKFNVYTSDFSEIEQMLREIDNKRVLRHRIDFWDAFETLVSLRKGDCYDADNFCAYEFKWELFSHAAHCFAEAFDYNNKNLIENSVEIDRARIAMELYSFAINNVNVVLSESRYGYKTAKALAYSLSQIAIKDFSHQKRKKYDPDNLVIHTVDKWSDDVVLGTIDAHTFNIPKDFIRHCEFYGCVDPERFVLEYLNVDVKEKIRYVDKTFDSIPVHSFELTINPEEYDIDKDVEGVMTYYSKNNALYIGFYNVYDGVILDVKSKEKINKIYLTDGKKDVLIWKS